MPPTEPPSYPSKCLGNWVVNCPFFFLACSVLLTRYTPSEHSLPHPQGPFRVSIAYCLTTFLDWWVKDQGCPFDDFFSEAVPRTLLSSSPSSQSSFTQIPGISDLSTIEKAPFLPTTLEQTTRPFGTRLVSPVHSANQPSSSLPQRLASDNLLHPPFDSNNVSLHNYPVSPTTRRKAVRREAYRTLLLLFSSSTTTPLFRLSQYLVAPS